MSKSVDLSTSDLTLLTNELKEVRDPHRLGITLGIESSDVTRVLQDHEDEILGILDHWLKCDSNASWRTLVKALKDMDHISVAERLAKTYISPEAKGA